MSLYVIRHGQVETNVKEQINGRNDESLNEIGILQAKKMSKEINRLNIDIVICSPLQRTKETCAYVINNASNVLYDDRLMERDSNSMMYQLVSTLDKKIWYDENKDIVYEDAEGFKSILRRVYELLEEIKNKYKDENVLLITHGDVCKAVYKYFNQEIEEIENFSQENCGIMKYDFK